jgi:DNA-binding response OmpR family regulator
VETKTRVLIVDDEDGILRFVRISLNLLGYDVTTTNNGADALRLAKAEKFDIILLDIVMAPMDGLEVLIELRTFSQVPVIVFTAQSVIFGEALELGANDSLAKPFMPQNLAKKIQEVLNR